MTTHHRDALSAEQAGAGCGQIPGSLGMTKPARNVPLTAPTPPSNGDVEGAVAFMEKAAVMLGRGEMPAPGTKYAADWYLAHRTVLSTLSASQEREARAREALERMASDTLARLDRDTPDVPGARINLQGMILALQSLKEAK